MMKKIEKYRYKLLFAFVLIFLVFPAFITSDSYSVILLITLSFIFIQSLWVFTNSKKQVIIGTVTVMVILFLIWFGAIFDDSVTSVRIFQIVLYTIFFGFVLLALFRMIIKSEEVTADVIFVSVSIYLIMGIIGGSLAFLLYMIYPDTAFRLPDTLQYLDLLDFTYFSFVTMSTLGYGDITPLRQETQALSYMLAVFGQLYVAIIVAIIVSKYISQGRGSK